MKFLADMGISQRVVRTLGESGYDAVHLRDQRLQRLLDPLIIEKAKQEEGSPVLMVISFTYHPRQAKSFSRKDSKFLNP